jgi:hypothetical protein
MAAGEREQAGMSLIKMREQECELRTCCCVFQFFILVLGLYFLVKQPIVTSAVCVKRLMTA